MFFCVSDLTKLIINFHKQMKISYDKYRALERKKQYELVYACLLKELANLPKEDINSKDTHSIKIYIENEIRKKIFRKKGVPTYFFNIIMLLGADYENSSKDRICNYISTDYLSEFQLFLNTEFVKLTDINKYYTKIKTIKDELDNIYFNLPQEWKVKQILFTEISVCIKQKICDLFFFNKYTEGEYLESVTTVIQNEGQEEFENGHVFRVFVPLLNLYYKNFYSYENNKKSLRNVCNSSQNESKTSGNECKLLTNESKIQMNECGTFIMNIFSNFLLFFTEFKQLYTTIDHFKNVDSMKLLIHDFVVRLATLVENTKKLSLYENYDNEHFYEYDAKDLVILITSLNTVFYSYTCLCELDSAITANYNFCIDEKLYAKLRSTEKILNGRLEIYIRNVIQVVKFDNAKVASQLITVLKNHVFTADMYNIFDEVKDNLIEVIVLQILSQIYLLDFDEDTAERFIYEMFDLKTFLLNYSKNLPAYQLIESYIKIFMCSANDADKFIHNFRFLSNNIFSFEQIVWSLKDKDNALDLLQRYMQKHNNG